MEDKYLEGGQVAAGDLFRTVAAGIPNPLEVQNRGFFLVCLVRASLTH